MEKIKTACGKQFDCDYFSSITSPSRAYIRICNSRIADVATVFSNYAETCQLWYGEHYLAQYTHLVAIVPEAGAIKVVLSKE